MNGVPDPACAIMATKEGPVLAAIRQEQEQAMAAAWPKVTMIRRQSPRKGSCTSFLLLKPFDAHVEVCWFHEPVVLARPLTIWPLQLEIKLAHHLWDELGHLKIRDVPADARSRSEPELSIVSL